METEKGLQLEGGGNWIQTLVQSRATALKTFVVRYKFDFWIQPLPLLVVWSWVPFRLCLLIWKIGGMEFPLMHWWRGQPDPLLFPPPSFPNGGVGASGAEFVDEVFKDVSPPVMRKLSPEWTLTLSPSFKVEEMEAFAYGFFGGQLCRFCLNKSDGFGRVQTGLGTRWNARDLADDRKWTGQLGWFFLRALNSHQILFCLSSKVWMCPPG